jgi:hypothetical protein
MPNNNTDATYGVHRGAIAAFDANNLHRLWSDECVWYYSKFNPPTVVDGRVFLATFADPVENAGDARTPDENCASKDPDMVAQPKVGFSWIIQYGLK